MAKGMVTTTQELAASERARLTELEAQAMEGFTHAREGFARAGEALEGIRDARLYRETHPTFEAYCEERWGFKASRARQLIAGWRTVTARNALGLPLPTSEWEARQMAQETARAARLKELEASITEHLANAAEMRTLALAELDAAEAAANGDGKVLAQAQELRERLNRFPWIDDEKEETNA